MYKTYQGKFSIIILSTIKALRHSIFSYLLLYYDFFPLNVMIEIVSKTLELEEIFKAE